MAYVYCHKCEAGQNEPTVRELIEGPVCWKCSEPLAIPGSRSKEILTQLLDRIERIEDHLGVKP